MRLFRNWLIACMAISFIYAIFTPPFQSPDEDDHFKRAYYLARGHLFLVTPPASSSGVMVDENLQRFIDIYRGLAYRTDLKVDADAGHRADVLKWSGREVFSQAPGTGLYFPAVYVPQATAIRIGQALDLTVPATYHLARILSLLTSAVLLLLAARFAPLPPLALVTLSLPMSIFQMSATSIDGICHGLTALCCSIIVQMARAGRLASRGDEADPDGATSPTSPAAYPIHIHVLLGLGLTALVTTRLHAAPLIVCVLATTWSIAGTGHRGTRTFVPGPGWWLAPAVAAASALWFIVAAPASIDLRVRTASQTYSSRALHFLANPVELVEIFARTLLASDRPASWAIQFLGKIGTNDTYLWTPVYLLLGLMWLLALASHFRAAPIPLPEQLQRPRSTRWVLIGAGTASALLVLLLLLIGYTKPNSATIYGVQGRYFIIPILLIAYGLKQTLSERSSTYLASAVLLTSALSGPAALSARYWMPRWSILGLT